MNLLSWLASLSVASSAFFGAGSGTIQQLDVWRSTNNYLTTIRSDVGLRVPGLATSTDGCLSVDSSGWIEANGSPCGSGSGFSTTSTDHWLTTKNTTNLSEGSNLYFTNARAQSALSGLYEVPLTFGDGLTRTSDDIDCDTASGSTFGCLSAANWTTFNNKENALTFNWPLTRSTNTISWSGLASSTAHAIGSVLYATGANTYGMVATTTTGTANRLLALNASGATTIPYASSTSITVSGAVDFDSFTSALLTTSASGVLAEYAGSQCAGTGYAYEVSALGVLTCSKISFLSDFEPGAILPISMGGTSLSTGPSYGQLLMGNSLGGYSLVSTSSLGISGGGAAYPFPDAGNATSTLTQFNGGLSAFASSSINFTNQGLSVYDSDASHHLTIVPTSNLTSNVQLSLSINANRTLTITGNVAMNQNVRTTDSPTFAALTLTSPLTVANGGTGATTASAAIGALGAATSTDVQVFTSSGTWTKPTGAQFVCVTVVGAGGAGGSGRRGGSAVIRGGGGGGGGGASNTGCFDADLLGASETVTVGVGGTGGAARVTDNTNGQAGTAGGSSSFGTWLFAGGGGGGGAGVAGNRGGGGGGGQVGNGGTGAAAAGVAGAPTWSINATGGAGSLATNGTPAEWGGGGAGSPNTAVGTGVGTDAGNSMYGSGGGGGGGSALAAGTEHAGGGGGASGKGTVGVGEGGAGGAACTNGTAGLDNSDNERGWGAQGGGGGGSCVAANAGNGGIGGIPGGGGGGGGGVTNGFTSGGGGDGGRGEVRVFTTF